MQDQDGMAKLWCLCDRICSLADAVVRQNLDEQRRWYGSGLAFAGRTLPGGFGGVGDRTGPGCEVAGEARGNKTDGVIRDGDTNTAFGCAKVCCRDRNHVARQGGEQARGSVSGGWSVVNGHVLDLVCLGRIEYGVACRSAGALHQALREIEIEAKIDDSEKHAQEDENREGGFYEGLAFAGRMD